MGEIADMMLEGEMCQYCGVYIDSDNGYPTPCAGCASEEAEDEGEDLDREKVYNAVRDASLDALNNFEAIVSMELGINFKFPKNIKKHLRKKLRNAAKRQLIK